jgi:hypothetical protein
MIPRVMVLVQQNETLPSGRTFYPVPGLLSFLPSFLPFPIFPRSQCPTGSSAETYGPWSSWMSQVDCTARNVPLQ